MAGTVIWYLALPVLKKNVLSAFLPFPNLSPLQLFLLQLHLH